MQKRKSSGLPSTGAAPEDVRGDAEGAAEHAAEVEQTADHGALGRRPEGVKVDPGMTCCAHGLVESKLFRFMGSGWGDQAEVASIDRLCLGNDGTTSFHRCFLPKKILQN